MHIKVKSNCIGHNPYFSRWFSAITKQGILKALKCCHNPYFSRWFSAMNMDKNEFMEHYVSQSLF